MFVCNVIVANTGMHALYTHSLFNPGVTVSLEQSLYIVSEADGFVEVCAAVTQGSLARDVDVGLRTEENINSASEFGLT